MAPFSFFCCCSDLFVTALLLFFPSLLLHCVLFSFFSPLPFASLSPLVFSCLIVLTHHFLLSSAEMKLVDVPDMGYSAAKGEGEIWMRGPSVSAGYYKVNTNTEGREQSNSKREQEGRKEQGEEKEKEIKGQGREAKGEGK